MPSIALTGSFGMGKTTVLRLFKKLGALTFEIDKLVHEILGRQEIINKIAAVLGNDVLRKTSRRVLISKERVADKIFNEPQKRKAVEKIIHPQVLREIKSLKTAILRRSPSSIIIFEVPLLFEANYERYFDKVIVVCCDRKTAINRLAKRGFSKEQALKRMRAQMPITRKIEAADFVIDNNNGIKKTESQVKRIFNELFDEHHKTLL